MTMPNNESVDIFGRRRRHPEKRIDCAAKLTPKRRQRKPSIRATIKDAEKEGKAVTSVTLPDGTTLRFGEAQTEQTNNEPNPWERAMQRPKQ
jgi:hypothetical protein